ncbi:MAG: YihY/virulence factor BrkB family protein [Lachnospiraceae bacterium]|nr:YihY/virulence factor BrkB family protein [Lachnospiraceae bacterium]
MKAERRDTLFRTLRLLFKNIFEHEILKSAAALAYYLLFALFPLLIFVSNLLGVLDLNVTGITQGLERFLPQDVTVILGTYLDYVSETSSHALLWFSLVFTIWFPMRAVKGLMDDVRTAYHLGRPKKPAIYRVRQLAYTVILLVVIALTLILSTIGQHVLEFANSQVPANILQFSDLFMGIWQYVRFIPMALLMYLAIGILYAGSMDEKPTHGAFTPGILTALILWMIVSVAFSFYVENFANYSIIYGALGAVIVLLMWLYLTAIILILGAEVNAALMTVRSEMTGSY